MQGSLLYRLRNGYKHLTFIPDRDYARVGSTLILKTGIDYSIDTRFCIPSYICFFIGECINVYDTIGICCSWRNYQKNDNRS